MYALQALPFNSTFFGGDVTRGHSHRTQLRRDSSVRMTTPIWACSPSWSSCKATLAGIDNNAAAKVEDRFRHPAPKTTTTSSRKLKQLQVHAMIPQTQAQNPVECIAEANSETDRQPDAGEDVMPKQEGYESDWDVHCDVLPRSRNCHQQQHPGPSALICEGDQGESSSSEIADSRLKERGSNKPQRLATLSWDYLD